MTKTNLAVHEDKNRVPYVKVTESVKCLRDAHLSESESVCVCVPDSECMEIYIIPDSESQKAKTISACVVIFACFTSEFRT